MKNRVVDIPDSTFSKVVCLDSVPSTEFVPTLQHKLSGHKNLIYSPAFLYAWEALQEHVKGEIREPKNNADLKLIEQSKSYRGTLSEGEYSTNVTEAGNRLSVSASFKKGLPFKSDMDTAVDGFDFSGAKVKAFGMPHYNKKIAGQIKILCYENDDKFILALIPADGSDEIMLAKGFSVDTTFEGLLEVLMHRIESSKEEWEKGASDWKFNFREGDVVLVPVMRFNYLANYKTITGEKIITDAKSYEIEKASQRNAFLLDEHGAKVESEAEVAVAAAAAPPTVGNAMPHDKKLLLDKEFILVLRKWHSQFPYFMMRVSNADIMLRR